MTSKRKAYLKLFILVVIIVVIPAILYLTCQDTLFNAEWIKALPDYFSDNKFTAAIILTGLQILQIVFFIVPGQPIQFAASYLFGVMGGLLISLVGAAIGVVIVFYLAKFLGTDALKNKFGEEKVNNYQGKINSGKGLLIAFFIYLIPGFPKDLVGYIAGISNMQILPFILISSIGRTPGMFISLFLGKFYQAKNYFGIVMIAVICLILLTICLIKKNDLVRLLDNLEAKDLEREARHNGKKADK